MELCCGAGHIGLLTLLHNARSLVMVDASEAACAFARWNAQQANLADRVEIRHGRVETCVGAESFPLVLADPPWVPHGEVGRYPDDPVAAIDGGEDGLGPARACMTVVGRVLHAAGRCVLQLGNQAQADVARGWLRSRPGLRLEIADIRVFDGRGVLVLLRRPGCQSPSGAARSGRHG